MPPRSIDWARRWRRFRIGRPQLPGAGWLAQQLLGIDPRRPLPRFERNHFRKWFAHAMRPRPESPNAAAARADRPAGRLPDQLLRAERQPRGRGGAGSGRLRSASWRVWSVADARSPPRAFWRKAQATWPRRTSRRLLPWAQRGVPIVGCEPSCLLMLVDEYPDLVPGDEAAAVAAHAALVDSHLVRASIELPLTTRPTEIVLHGHCHQKALVGAAGHAGRAGHDSRRQVAAGRLGLLRHGRLVRLRALRHEHGDRRAGVVSGGAQRDRMPRSPRRGFPAGTRSNTARAARPDIRCGFWRITFRKADVAGRFHRFTAHACRSQNGLLK